VLLRGLRRREVLNGHSGIKLVKDFEKSRFKPGSRRSQNDETAAAGRCDEKQNLQRGGEKNQRKRLQQRQHRGYHRRGPGGERQLLYAFSLQGGAGLLYVQSVG